MNTRKIFFPVLLFIVCLVISNDLLKEQDNRGVAEPAMKGKDMYAIWLAINAIEEELEGPEGAKELLEAESDLLECGEMFKSILKICEEEKGYDEWDAFAQAFMDRNRAILNYIEALKKYEQSEKFQIYQAFLRKYQVS